MLFHVLDVNLGENNPHQFVHVQPEHINATVTNVVIVLQIVLLAVVLEIIVILVIMDMITNHTFVHVPLILMKKMKSVMLVTHYVPLVVVLMKFGLLKPEVVVLVKI
jgi:hypothetical protein